jgi:hypothetical protein
MGHLDLPEISFTTGRADACCLRWIGQLSRFYAAPGQHRLSLHPPFRHNNSVTTRGEDFDS